MEVNNGKTGVVEAVSCVFGVKKILLKFFYVADSVFRIRLCTL